MSNWQTFKPFTYCNIRTYHWRTEGNRSELLTAGRVVAKVMPDVTYPRMWRIDLGSDALSDMVNLSRARDAAVRLADARLNVRKPRAVARPMRETDPAATLVSSDTERALEPVRGVES